MMTFEKFKDEVKTKIEGYLHSSITSVCIESTQKTNGLHDYVVVVTTTTEGVTPRIHLKSFYDEYESGTGLEKVIKKIATNINNAQKFIEDTPFGEIVNFEKVKTKILPKLINAEENKDLLMNLPHRPIADLAVIYLVYFSDIIGCAVSINITNWLAACYDVGIDELHQISVENMEKYHRIEFVGLLTKLNEMLPGYISNIPNNLKSGITEDTTILSVRDYSGGAAAILSMQTMESIIL